MNIAPEITTTLVGMLPLAELRLAIPLGKTLGLTQFQAFFYGTLGNIIIVLPIVYVYGPISKWLGSKSKFFYNFFQKLQHSTHTKHHEKFLKYGPLALILFVAIPLPGTGGWTGSLAAWIFGIEPRRASKLIVLGIIIAGALVSIGVESIEKIASIILPYANILFK
jgi:uncharacterized membrane protein